MEGRTAILLGALLAATLPAHANDPPEQIAKVLSGADREAALRAAQALADVGPAGAAALAPLTECLLDDDFRLRDAAADALGSIGKAAAPALPALDRLVTGRPDDRALRAMVRIGPPAAPYIVGHVLRKTKRRTVLAEIAAAGERAKPVLLALLAHESWHVRMWTIRYARRPQDPDWWVERAAHLALRDPSEAVRVAAVRVLADKSNVERTQAHLVALVRAEKTAAGRAALLGLSRLPALSAEAVGAVRAALAAGPSRNRALAAHVLGRDRDSIPLLRRSLEDPDPFVGEAAAGSLALLGVWDPPVLARTISVLRRGNFSPSFPAPHRRNLRAGRRPNPDARFLAALRRGDGPVVRALFESAKTAKPEFKVKILHVLGSLEAIPEGFRRFLDDPDRRVRRTAAFALAERKDAGPKVVRLLVGCLGSHGDDGLNAASSLKALGARTVPFLLEAYEADLRRLNPDLDANMIELPGGYDRLMRDFGKAALPHVEAALRRKLHPAVRTQFEGYRDLAR